MQVTVFSPYGIHSPHFQTELEIIQTHLDRGDRPTVLICDGQLPACDSNPHHDKARCVKCVGRRRAGLKLLSASPEAVPLFDDADSDATGFDRLQTAFSSVEELKRYRLDDFDVGCAVLSSVVSVLREPDVDLHRHRRMVRNFMRAAWMVHTSMRRYLRRRRPDRVYLFNGRFAPLRAVRRACEAADVPFVTHERGCDLNHYWTIENTTIHDRKYVEAAIRDAWDRAGRDSDRERVARRWFEDRAGGVRQNWYSFVDAQRRDLLPAGWDAEKRNVAAFVSSEDEFVGIGDEWDNPIYGTQMKGLAAIVDAVTSTSDRLHLYVRVHPNLADLDNSQTRALARMQSPRVTVIPAESPVGSYALLGACDKVLAFGSTIGIEAVHWGKPSVLAGAAYYGNLGGVYVPATHEELMAMLRADLAPRDAEAALMYGYFFATFGTRHNHYRPRGLFEGTFKGTRVAPDPLSRAKILALGALFPSRMARKTLAKAGVLWRRYCRKAA